MTTFTPGPWKVYSQYGEIGNITNSDGSIVVAQAQQVDPRSHEVRLANTHLIASEPELLEALQLLLHEVDESAIAGATDYGWPIAVEKSRAAIAKARGAQ